MILTEQEKYLGLRILKNGLKGPLFFDFLSEQQIKELTNGCGPKGAGWLVPERIFDASFRNPCKIHDLMYLMGYEKKFADQVFYENCMEKTRGCFPLVRPAAEWAAFMYYLAVKNAGTSAYNKAIGEGQCLGINLKGYN